MANTSDVQEYSEQLEIISIWRYQIDLYRQLMSVYNIYMRFPLIKDDDDFYEDLFDD